jgi:hypothetical protein
VTYTCEDGYNMDGSSTAQCDTTGNYQKPTCSGNTNLQQHALSLPPLPPPSLPPPSRFRFRFDGVCVCVCCRRLLAHAHLRLSMIGRQELPSSRIADPRHSVGRRRQIPRR